MADSKNIALRFAERYGVDQAELSNTLKATAFKVSGAPVTDVQMMALMIVADQYKLNPFTKEIFAFPDRGGVVPVVSVDGWCRIINEHPQMNGIDFVDGPEDAKTGVPAWIECVIYRKDREHPTRVRERFNEVKRATPPWASHPSRMLRHKALIQCSRVAFGFAGIYDEDEAVRIVEASAMAIVVDGKPVNEFMPAETQREAPKSAPTLDVDTETGEVLGPVKTAPASDEPVATNGMLKTLRATMAAHAKSDDAFHKNFGFPIESMPKSQINTALTWAKT